MSPVSDNFRSEAFAATGSQPLLTLMKVMFENNDGSAEDLYFVNNNVAIDSNVTGVVQTYQPSAFEVELAGDNKDKSGDLTLSFDSADRDVIRRLRAIEKRPEVEIYIVLGDDVNFAEFGPFEYQCKSFSVTANVVSVTLEVEPVLNEPIPGDRFTPQLFPGLWDDVNIIPGDSG